MSTDFPIYNPTVVYKKEARGLGDDTDFEVQEILREYVITQKGNAAKNILLIILFFIMTFFCKCRKSKCNFHYKQLKIVDYIRWHGLIFFKRVLIV
mgnify:CR=1 FL=1